MNGKEIFQKGARAGWMKYEYNPVLGGSLGTCFDICVIKDDECYRMYFSWRPKKSIAITESTDGIHWSEPFIVLSPRETAEGWEDELNRPYVLKLNGVYHMWYTGQFKPGEADGKSWVFYAKSMDGISWERASLNPVISADMAWEKAAVMCPSVIWDEKLHLFKVWYSAGEQYEPNAIGYAESHDGFHWNKHKSNPVFSADSRNIWEQHKVAGGQVFYRNGWYVMFYIGYYNEHYAQIGIARSRDGISSWERHPENPVIAPGEGGWDNEACYKPFAIFDGNRWLLWYNGRVSTCEQIGIAFHEGEDLGFDK